MPKFTKVLSTSIKAKRLITKVLGLGSNDSATPFNAMPPGLDARPIKGMRAVFMDTGNDSEPVIVGYINENSKAAEGEMRIYSVNSNGEEQNYIWVKNDGTIEIGGDVDNMVRYSKLQVAFDELNDKFNAHLTDWNTFAAAYVPGGPAIQGTPPTAGTSITSTADIVPAKIDEVKTN